MRSINLGRWSRRVERYFNMKGGGGLMDVEQSIRVVLPIASGVEERYLEGWNRFSVVVNVAPVAAQFSRVRIRNPVNSGVITVLEQLSAYIPSGGAAMSPIVTWGAVTTDLTTLATLTFTRLDPRGQPTPTAIVSQNQQAAGGQALMQRSLSAPLITTDFINNPNQEITNLPGQAVDIQAEIANDGLVVTLMWRERALEASELT